MTPCSCSRPCSLLCYLQFGCDNPRHEVGGLIVHVEIPHIVVFMVYLFILFQRILQLVALKVVYFLLGIKMSHLENLHMI